MDHIVRLLLTSDGNILNIQYHYTDFIPKSNYNRTFNYFTDEPSLSVFSFTNLNTDLTNENTELLFYR